MNILENLTNGSCFFKLTYSPKDSNYTGVYYYVVSSVKNEYAGTEYEQNYGIVVKLYVRESLSSYSIEFREDIRSLSRRLNTDDEYTLEIASAEEFKEVLERIVHGEDDVAEAMSKLPIGKMIADRAAIDTIDAMNYEAELRADHDAERANPL